MDSEEDKKTSLRHSSGNPGVCSSPPWLPSVVMPMPRKKRTSELLPAFFPLVFDASWCFSRREFKFVLDRITKLTKKRRFSW